VNSFVVSDGAVAGVLPLGLTVKGWSHIHAFFGLLS
jgi:hypothetical protein